MLLVPFWGIKETADLSTCHSHRFRYHKPFCSSRSPWRHFGDIGVNVFFRVSGASCAGFNEEQKDSHEWPSLRVHLYVEPAFSIFWKGLYLVSHNMIISAFGLHSAERFFVVRWSKNFFMATPSSIIHIHIKWQKAVLSIRTPTLTYTSTTMIKMMTMTSKELTAPDPLNRALHSPLAT